MTEQDKEIQELRQRVKKIEGRLKAALSDLVYVLNQHSLCEICEYRDADCEPDGGNCVPRYREKQCRRLTQDAYRDPRRM